MGINGLLKGLQGYGRKSNIREFSGQSVAVDASSWLHKSVYSVSEKYVEAHEASRIDKSCVRTSQRYVADRCQELLVNARINKVYLVFDGKRCPLKAKTNQDREARRAKNLEEARQYKRQRRIDKAFDRYKACIKISDAHGKAVADAVTQQFASDGRVVCVFSPYEADAQLVKLCVDGHTNAIITEVRNNTTTRTKRSSMEIVIVCVSDLQCRSTVFYAFSHCAFAKLPSTMCKPTGFGCVGLHSVLPDGCTDPVQAR